jgi:hypothetical protein
MSVLAPIREIKSKIHHSEYITSEDKPAGDTKPAEESKPTANSEGNDQATPTEPAAPAK